MLVEAVEAGGHPDPVAAEVRGRRADGGQRGGEVPRSSPAAEDMIGERRGQRGERIERAGQAQARRGRSPQRSSGGRRPGGGPGQAGRAGPAGRRR